MKPVPVSSVFEKNALSVRGRWGPEGASGQPRSAAVSRGAGAGMEKKKTRARETKKRAPQFLPFHQPADRRRSIFPDFALFGEKSDREEDSFSRFFQSRLERFRRARAVSRFTKPRNRRGNACNVGNRGTALFAQQTQQTLVLERMMDVWGARPLGPRRVRGGFARFERAQGSARAPTYLRRRSSRTCRAAPASP